MMGDTFNTVKENSDRDWKFYRYHLIAEYLYASFHPPPFSLVVVPLKRFRKTNGGYSAQPVGDVNYMQQNKLKIIMKGLKDKYLTDRDEEETKKIGAVSDSMKENFKLLLEVQDEKYRSLEARMTEMSEKNDKLSAEMSAKNDKLSAEMSAKNDNLSAEMSARNDKLSALVETELGKMHDSLARAVKGEKTPESVVFRIQNRDIQVTWNEGVQKGLVSMMLHEYKPFTEWVECMNKSDNMENIQVKSINVHYVDLFGPRIGFVKFHAKVVNEAGADVPGIVFMRGAAVAILVILKLDSPDSAEHGKEFTILTIQLRVPAGKSRFAEIPAGMLDGGKFAGVAAKELKEETGIDIQEDKLIDLTGLAYGDNHSGMYPSAGGCDEYLRLFLYRTTVSRAELDGYKNRMTGVLEEGEKITLKVVPLEDLWFEAPDAKALAAEALYHKVMKKGLVSADF